MANREYYKQNIKLNKNDNSFRGRNSYYFNIHFKFILLPNWKFSYNFRQFLSIAEEI